MFNFFRKLFSWGVTKNFPHKFRVTVSIDHPQVTGHIISVYIDIDAYNKHHARERLRNELTFFIGGATQVNTNRKSYARSKE